jgi:hypothetical protein
MVEVVVREKTPIRAAIRNQKEACNGEREYQPGISYRGHSNDCATPSSISF